MLRNRFCIIRRDRRVTGSCLRLLGKAPRPELALHPCTENNLLWAEEEGEGLPWLLHTDVWLWGTLGGRGPAPILLTHADPGLCSSLPRTLLWESICKPRVPQPGKPREMYLFPHHTQGWVNKDRYDGGVSSEDTLLLRDLGSTDTQNMGDSSGTL